MCHFHHCEALYHHSNIAITARLPTLAGNTGFNLNTSITGNLHYHYIINGNAGNTTITGIIVITENTPITRNTGITGNIAIRKHGLILTLSLLEIATVANHCDRWHHWKRALPSL